MNVLLSTGSYKFEDDQIEKIKAIKGVNLLIQDDERDPILHDISLIEYLITFSLLKQYNVDDFTSLKQVQTLSAGLDHMPVEKLKKRNIPLKNALGVFSPPIAEFVILYALQIYKHTRFFEENQKDKAWLKHRDLMELTDKRVAIIGYGGIGNEVAKRFSAFGAKIISFSRSEKQSPFIDEQYNLSTLAEHINNIDITVICVPYSEDTHEMFDKNLISKMKDKSVLINVARGKIINENDLIEAIKNDKFFGVALDVVYDEPLSKDSELWGFDNVYITPHNSFFSNKIKNRMFEIVYKSLKDAVKS